MVLGQELLLLVLPMAKRKRSALVDKAITLLGSQDKLAKACGVSQHAIWKALQGYGVSPALAAAIEHATDGAVKRHHVCSQPEVFAGLGLPDYDPDDCAAPAA